MADGKWTDVTVGDDVVGYVYRATSSSVWVCMLDEGHGARKVGTAQNKTDAVSKVVAAYLRT